MREKLIELLKKAHEEQKYITSDTSINAIVDFLLENGVVVPHCKVGDTVYAVYNNKVYQTKVFSMIAETEDNKWVYILKCKIFDAISMFKKFLFGKTVFLNREDAERALKGGVKE